MTNQNKLLNLLDQQKTSHESLSECFLKAEALINVALSCDFLDYPETTVHSYLWVLSDIVGRAKKLNEESMNLLLNHASCE